MKRSVASAHSSSRWKIDKPQFGSYPRRPRASLAAQAGLRYRAMTGRLAGLGDHGGAYRGVGCLIDQDEAAGSAVPGVGVAEDGLGEPEPDPADLVEPQLDRGLVAVQGVHVDPVVQVGDDR